MRKKIVLFAALALVLTGCKTELGNKGNDPTRLSETIGFQVGTENTTRSQALNASGHYNFGVFAYKSTDLVNNIMDNYLVGYHDDANAYSTAGTTVGDQDGLVDGASYWMYEGLGSAEFTGTYAGQRLNAGEQFASNVANQYLRYWDKAAAATYFYAYAPYVNTVFTGKEVTYVDGQEKGTSTDKYVMTIPNGTLKHGYDDEAKYEFMYASTKVEKANYGHDVALSFKRLNAKVNIKFWEDIPGYSVRIINVTDAYSVSAVPAIKDGTSNYYGYKLGKIYTENGAKIQFTDGAQTGMKQYEGTTTSAPLNFVAPADAQIGTARIEATPSPTTYYAIPKGSAAGVLLNGADKYTDAGTLNTDLALTGLTFHVSYELISTSGEVITVKDATVFVPTTYTNWLANTHYTYIFKITTNSNGTTDSADTPNPEDPEVPTEKGLYPIIFDNCTVEDWNTSESEHIITDGTTIAYHDVQLTPYSLVSGDIVVEVTDHDTYAGHAIDYTKITVAGPDAADENTWYNSTTHKITVPAGAAAGLYTVTYTCNTPAALQYNNHPATWTETFVVGNAYTVSTNLDEVGTHGLAATALSISATKDGDAFTPDAAQLSIEYPVNLEAADKALVKVSADGKTVEVANTAAPGKYKLVLKIDEGVEVKVAEKVFEVKDYQFALSKSIVDLGATAVEITATDPSGVGVISMATATGITVTDATKKISVANTAEEGTYTVTYTLYGESTDPNHVSTVQYQATFKVQNVYTVALSKNTLNTTVGAANAAEYGTDFIDITSTKNGVADELSDATAAKYSVPGITAGDYKITYIAAVMYQSTDPEVIAGTKTTSDIKTPAHIALQVKKSVAAGNYTVVYTGQADKKPEAVFTIQK